VAVYASRAPKDLDLLTIFWSYDLAFLNQLVTDLPAFMTPAISIRDFKLDKTTTD